MAGGVGRDGVRAFDRDHLAGKVFSARREDDECVADGWGTMVEELVISLPTQRPLIGSWAGCLTLPVFR
jgi:hypothetical protein